MPVTAETGVAQTAPSQVECRQLEAGVEQQEEKCKDIFPFSRLSALVIPALFRAMEQHHLALGKGQAAALAVDVVVVLIERLFRKTITTRHLSPLIERSASTGLDNNQQQRDAPPVK